MNPFLYSRREFERETPLYVPGGAEGFLDWVSGQQYLFEGIRGSGKTSILKSMEWEAVWRTGRARIEGPPEIRRFFEGPPNHLAVWCRFDEMDTGYWDSWNRLVGTECSQSYFGTYLEYMLLDLLLSAMLAIVRRSDSLRESPESEAQLVSDLLQVGFPTADRRPRLPEQSLVALRQVIRDQHLAVRDLVYRRTHEETMRNTRYPILSPGSLIQCFGRSLTANYREFGSLKVFPMLDDCHYLTNWQTAVVNSAVSRASNPVAYKLTSVLGLYKTRTTADDRPLGEQELKTVRISGAGQLKWKHAQKYRGLVQGVCQTRIKGIYGEDVSRRFDFRALLGPFDLQTLLERILSDSEKPKAILLLEQAKQDAARKQSRTSITSTWLNEKRVRELERPSYDKEGVQRMFLRRLDSMYTKKFAYSAAVAICQDEDLRLPFPYCGWSTILHLSNGSIREVLKIMYEIWGTVNLPIERFVEEREVNWREQRQAIRRAAADYFNGLDKKPLLDINYTGRNRQEIDKQGYPPSSLPSICRRLGLLFARFQSFPSVCVAAETASLKVRRDQLDSDTARAIDFGVMSAVLLKIEDGSTTAIGLNPFFAPMFNISFRSPFYSSEPVCAEDLIALFKGTDAEAEKASERILENRMKRYRRHIKGSNTQMDFLETVDDG